MINNEQSRDKDNFGHKTQNEDDDDIPSEEAITDEQSRYTGNIGHKTTKDDK